MDVNPYFINTVFLGRLQSETIINSNNEIILEKPGGNLLYSACSHQLWGKSSGLLSKVGANLNETLINDIQQMGFNTSGLRRISKRIDHRSFFYIDEFGKVIRENPQKYFLCLGVPVPKSLLGYAVQGDMVDSKKTCQETSIKPEDIPSDFFDCQNLALCPLDYVSHSLVPVEFRSKGNARLFIHASKGYMNPSFFYEFPSLVQGAALFFSSLENIERLFLGKVSDIWEILEYLASLNIETSIIAKPNEGYYLYLKPHKTKFFVPDFPAKLIDPVGIDDVFFGAYIANFISHFDPVKASIAGAVSASLKKEGSSAKYICKTLPELAQARLEKHFHEVTAI